MRPTNFPSGLVNTRPYDNDSLRLRLGSCVPPSLQNYECPFNWLQLYPGSPLSLVELEHGVLILEEKFRDESQEMYTKSSSRFQDTTEIFRIARKFSQAQFNAELQRYQESKKNLSEVKRLIDNWSEHNANPEYLQGFLYAFQGMQVFLEEQISRVVSPMKEVVRRNFKERHNSGKYCLEGLQHFSRLPAKAKYIVWTVRDVFLIYCSRANVQRTDWMTELLLEMEPYVAKWHFYLYRALHGRRKLVKRPLPLLLLDPTELDEDGTELGDPTSCGVFEDDYVSISYQCLCLAQIFGERMAKITGTDGATTMIVQEKEKSTVNQYYPWRFGQHSFETPDQVLECIMEKTIYLLEVDCHLDGVYLNLSEVYLFTLPPPLRNTELALRCLKKALRLKTDSPRTHYRMGLALFKLKDEKQAAHHFREVMIHNPANIGAIFGLLQLLMAHPLENGPELQQLFKNSIKNLELIRVWDKRCLRTLHYLKGCYHFMLLQEEPVPGEDCLNEAITSWIIAHDNESPKWSYYFLNLAHQSAVFQWPSKRLNLTSVSNALKHAAYLERTQFRQLLLDICAEVDDAICRSSGNNTPAQSQPPTTQL